MLWVLDDEAQPLRGIAVGKDLIAAGACSAESLAESLTA